MPMHTICLSLHFIARFYAAYRELHGTKTGERMQDDCNAQWRGAGQDVLQRRTLLTNVLAEIRCRRERCMNRARPPSAASHSASVADEVVDVEQPTSHATEDAAPAPPTSPPAAGASNGTAPAASPAAATTAPAVFVLGGACRAMAEAVVGRPAASIAPLSPLCSQPPEAPSAGVASEQGAQQPRFTPGGKIDMPDPLLGLCQNVLLSVASTCGVKLPDTSFAPCRHIQSNAILSSILQSTVELLSSFLDHRAMYHTPQQGIKPRPGRQTKLRTKLAEAETDMAKAIAHMAEQWDALLLSNIPDAEAMQSITHHLGSITELLQSLMRPLRHRVSELRSSGKISRVQSGLVNLVHNCSLTWGDVTESLLRAEAEGVRAAPLTYNQLASVCQAFQEEKGITMEAIAAHYSIPASSLITHQLLMLMPLIAFTDGGVTMIFNLHSFSALLNIYDLMNPDADAERADGASAAAADEGDGDSDSSCMEGMEGNDHHSHRQSRDSRGQWINRQDAEAESVRLAFDKLELGAAIQASSLVSAAEVNDALPTDDIVRVNASTLTYESVMEQEWPDEDEDEDPDFNHHSSWGKSHPDAVELVRQTVANSGVRAHEKRRSATGTVFGCTVGQLRRDLTKAFADMKQPSAYQVNSLFDGDHRLKSTRKRLRLIDAKLVKRKAENKLASSPANGHAAAAQVRVNGEEAARFNRSTKCVAFDDKALGAMGYTTLFSRYQRVRKIFQKGDEPTTPHHDFPYHGYKMAITGVLEMPHVDDIITNGESSRPLVLDALGREHYALSRTGCFNLFMRPHRDRPTTAASHASDVYTVAERARTAGEDFAALYITADNCSDSAPANQKVAYHFGELWEELKLLKMLIGSYLAEQSFYNPPECGWCVVGNAGSGFTCDVRHPSSGQVPCKMSGISKSILAQLEADVFENATLEVASLLDNYRTEMYTLKAQTRCRSDVDKFKQPPEYFFDVSKTRMMGNSALREQQRKYKFFLKHFDMRHNQNSASPCFRVFSCNHCKELEAIYRDHPVHKDYYAYLRAHRYALVLCWSPTDKEHFCTYKELLQMPEEGEPDDVYADNRHVENRCHICPRSICTSKTARATHMKLCHRVAFNEDEPPPQPRLHRGMGGAMVEDPVPRRCRAMAAPGAHVGPPPPEVAAPILPGPAAPQEEAAPAVFPEPAPPLEEAAPAPDPAMPLRPPALVPDPAHAQEEAAPVAPAAPGRPPPRKCEYISDGERCGSRARKRLRYCDRHEEVVQAMSRRNKRQKHRKGNGSDSESSDSNDEDWVP